MEDDGNTNPKVSGYLEKKGKMKMMSTYKKYWFVLEGRLLLYYRSKDEYKAISPCKGSINLGPPCNVKPCSSSHGVFQIETRSNTITLKAESQEDQNRWMLGIMSAINQTKNSNKLGHFRYSYDEIPQQYQQKITQHQLQYLNNTENMFSQTGILQLSTSKDANEESSSHKHEDIIQRLQKMGAQTYHGGNIATISQINNRKKNHSPCSSEESLQSPEPLNSSSTNILNENEQNPDQGILNNVIPRIENIYEQISRDLPESSIGIEINDYKQNKKGEDKNFESSPDRPSTLLLENETYAHHESVTTHNKEDTSDTKFRRTLENSYISPKYSTAVDHNKNNVLNDLKVLGIANAHSSRNSCNMHTTANNNTELYEYLDVAEYTEVKYTDNDISDASRQKKDPLLKKANRKTRNKNKTPENRKEVKKSSSFIRRVWKRKDKSKEPKTEECENLYESVPAAIVEKVCLADNTAIQMLSELHNILENKMPILSERLSSETISNERDQNRPKKDISCKNNNFVGKEENAVQMLTELQNILENKKNGVSVNTFISRDKTQVNTTELEKDENTMQRSKKSIENMFGSEKEHPYVPPKQCKSHNMDSTSQKLPKKNCDVNNKPLPPKKENFENIKSLDEILYDLEKQKEDTLGETKVKKLIKRFSETDFNEDVTLRTDSKRKYYNRDVDSDELNKLLDELAKVTCAPILTRGVTTSLINPSLTDEELSNLIPKHRRRYSEPDYDIPRPHKSLTSFQTRETPSDGVIGSTRFFGPILKPSDIIANIIKIKDSLDEIPSMTPDSLEVELQELHPPTATEDEKEIVYISHYCVKNKCCKSGNGTPNIIQTKPKTAIKNVVKSLPHCEETMIDNDIYVQPNLLYERKSETKLININTQGLSFNNSKNVNPKYEEGNEDFIDSLEM